MLAPIGAEPAGEFAEAPARRSPYVRILIGGVVAVVVWSLLPSLPQDQTVIFALGPNADRLAQLEVQWEAVGNQGSEHEGSVILNFPAPTPERTTSERTTPERIVRQFRLANGQYAFRVSGVQRDALRQRTEVTRQVTLEGKAITLSLEELSH